MSDPAPVSTVFWSVAVLSPDPVALLAEHTLGPGEDVVVGRPGLDPVAAGPTYDRGGASPVARLGRSALDAGEVGLQAVVGGAQDVVATVARQDRAPEAGTDLVSLVAAPTGREQARDDRLGNPGSRPFLSRHVDGSAQGGRSTPGEGDLGRGRGVVVTREPSPLTTSSPLPTVTESLPGPPATTARPTPAAPEVWRGQCGPR